MQLYRFRLPSEKISYYSGKRECDFVIQRGERVVQLIQAAWNLREQETLAREIKGLMEASDVTGCDNLLILTDDDERIIKEGGKEIRILPVWKWLLSNREEVGG